MLPKVGVKRAAGEDRRREFSVSWAWTMLSFATMRSSVRSRLAPPWFQSLGALVFGNYVPIRSNSSIDRPALRLLHLSLSRFHHLHRARHCPPLTVGHVLRVDVHSGGDASVPHLSLHVLRVGAGLDHPSGAG